MQERYESTWEAWHSRRRGTGLRSESCHLQEEGSPGHPRATLLYRGRSVEAMPPGRRVPGSAERSLPLLVVLSSHADGGVWAAAPVTNTPGARIWAARRGRCWGAVPYSPAAALRGVPGGRCVRSSGGVTLRPALRRPPGCPARLHPSPDPDTGERCTPSLTAHTGGGLVILELAALGT